MGRPTRMNLVDVVIKQIDFAKTHKDEDFREGRGVIRYQQPITLRAQVNYGDVKYHFKQRDPSFTGDQDKTAGHLVFKVTYLENLGITLNKGDFVVSVAGVPMNLVIRELRYESSLRGKFLLLYAVMETRRRSN